MASEEIEAQKDPIKILISSETEDDDTKKHMEAINNTKEHTKSTINEHRNSIDSISVPQYMNEEYDSIHDTYVVTYSKKDNSILGWSVKIKENIQQKCGLYFELDRDYDIVSFKLYKKFLLFHYNDKNSDNKSNYRK